jgi:hypothetical protein
MSNITRVNISMPKRIFTEVRNFVSGRNFSKFVTSAIEEKMARMKREEALKRLVEAPASFTDVDDPVAHVKTLRAGDEERAKRLGI